MENRFVQIDDEWLNMSRVEYLADDAKKKKLFIWFSDSDDDEPFVFEAEKREAFLHYLENNSYRIPISEKSAPKKAIPGGVLVDIFRAIYGDKYALQEAAKVLFPVTTEFQGALEQVLLYLSVPEVREHLIKELDGVDYDSDNK